MQVRVARQTGRLNDVLTFYRDGLGLSELDRFTDHDGYTGVMLDLPETGTHLEFTATEHLAPPTPHPEELLVLYVGSRAEVDRLVARSGARPVPNANPFWERVGVTIADPDGFRVVLVPGSWPTEPSPPAASTNGNSDRSPVPTRATPQESVPQRQRDEPVNLRLVVAEPSHVDVLVEVLAEADEDSDRIRAQLRTPGRVAYRALVGEELVGAAVMQWQLDSELVYLAVAAGRRRRGHGSAMVAALLREAAARGVRSVIVGTANSSLDNIAFYQRCGFRMDHIRSDYFDYVQPPITEHGIPMRDMIVFRAAVQGVRSSVFCDAALAERIERAEATLIAEASEAARRRQAEPAGFVIPVGGGVASFAEEGSPFNKVAGLGFGPLPRGATMDQVERAFAARTAPVQVEVAHLADPETGAMLADRGYRLVSFENVLGIALAGERGRVTPPGIEVLLSGDDELESWLAVVVEAAAHPDTEGLRGHESFTDDVIERAERDLVSASGVRRYIARHDGVPAGAASMRIADGVAQLTGAGTMPAHRHRGIHTALLSARLADAAAAGCDLAVVTTAPASRSQQNVQAQGFDLLYTRAILIKEP